MSVTKNVTVKAISTKNAHATAKAQLEDFGC